MPRDKEDKWNKSVCQSPGNFRKIRPCKLCCFYDFCNLPGVKGLGDDCNYCQWHKDYFKSIYQRKMIPVVRSR